MGEEVQMSDCEKDVRGGDEERMLEWEVGLPNTDDLTPLSHYLISPELASAFSISPEPCKSMVDVNRASENALSSLRLQAQAFSLNKSLPSFKKIDDPLIVEEEEEDDPGRITKDGSDARKIRRLDITEEEDSALRMENSNEDYSSPALKRSRLVWTPQLHKRFIDVVGHLGIKNAVPKTIMQLMNVEGLTRENVASHLQKYRLYLKRMQGFEVPSSSDHLFASAPEPQSLQESSGTGNVNGTGTGTGNGNGNGQMQLPMPYAASFMPMQVMGMAHGHSHMGMAVGNPAAVGYHGYESHPYSMFKEQQGDWSGNKFGLAVSHPHVTPNDI